MLPKRKLSVSSEEKEEEIVLSTEKIRTIKERTKKILCSQKKQEK